MAHSMVMNRPETHEVLLELIRLKEISVSELAKLVDLPQPTVQRIATGVYKNPHISTLRPIAEFFNVTVNQLKGFESIPFLFNKQTLRNIPLITTAQVLAWPKIEKKEITEQIACDIKIGNTSFAMYMPDASMEPLIPKGSTLLVDPDKTPHHRSFILVKIHDHPEVIIRQLITDARNLFIKPLSPDLEQLKMILLDKKDKILGTIIQVRLNCENY